MNAKYISLKLRTIFLVLMVATVYGCGGSGTAGVVTSSSSTLSGTVATGAPIANATVHIKGANGVMVETTTDANGNYTSPSLSTLTAPYLVHVIKAGPPVVELYSIGSAAGVVNVHPLTDMIIRTWYEVQGTDVVTEFNAATPAAPPTATELGVIKQVVKNLVAQFLGLIGNVDSTSFDLISTPFTANSTGFDKFLDNIQVSAASGVIGINTSGVSGAGTLAEYQATLAVSGTSMTSTLAQDLDNNAAFTTVSTATNPITGITASPYAGVWRISGEVTVANAGTTGCGAGDPVGKIYILLPFVIDANGNFILMDPDFPSFMASKGNVATDGAFTFHAYGDTLVNAAGIGNGTCAAASASGTMSSPTAGTGNLVMIGQTLVLTLTRLSDLPSPFAGVWKFTYTATQILDTVNCGGHGINIPVVDGDGLIVIDAAGDFVSVASAISGHVNPAGAVTFIDTEGGLCTFVSAAGTLSGTNGNGTFGTFNAGDLYGTWTLVRQ